LTCLPLPVGGPTPLRVDHAGVDTNDLVGAPSHRDRSLRVLSKGETGYAEGGRLLLDPARIRQDAASVRHDLQELQIGQRIRQTNIWHGRRLTVESFQSLPV